MGIGHILIRRAAKVYNVGALRSRHIPSISVYGPFAFSHFCRADCQHKKRACSPHYRIQLVLGRARMEFLGTASVP